MKIDLDNYINKNVKVLSGRNEGKELRRKLNIDAIDKSEELIDVIIPEKIYSLNSSFFLGFLGPSIRALGEVGFKRKFKFICDEVIMKNVEDGIVRALKESNALGKPEND